jgi:hypothetical protein
MNETLAFCGLACDSCPIHLATLETDISKKAAMRIKIAEELARIYGTTSTPESITDCDGCLAENGRLFNGCADCRIRKCAIGKNMINCAFCREYVCESLAAHFKYDPASRERLENIKLNENVHFDTKGN